MSTATRRQAKCVAISGESMDGEGDAVFRIGTMALYNQPSNETSYPKLELILNAQDPVSGRVGCVGALWYDNGAGNIATLRPDRRYSPLRRPNGYMQSEGATRSL
jgi:hypothetical protein